MNWYQSKQGQIIILLGFFLINLILRLPAFFHELAPWSFCDEDLMVDYAFRMLKESDMKAPHFLSGGINFYIPILMGKLSELITGHGISPENFRILARVATAGILSSATVFFIYAVVKELGGTFSVALTTIAIFTFSPMILGISRYHYPDHYMVFFVTAAIYAIVRVSHSRLESPDIARRYLWAGLWVGLMCSVKYSGFLLFLLLGFASFLTMLLEMRDRRKAPLAVFLNYAKLVIYGTVSASLAFIATNPSMFQRWESFKEGLMVKHYGPAVSLMPGIQFYTSVLYLTFFGVLGSVALIWGIREFWRRDRFMALIFLILPIGIPIFFSRYNLLYNRNVTLAAPFVILLSGFGLHAILKWLRSLSERSMAIPACVVLLFFAEPLYRSAYSYQRDFRADSRLQAQKWFQEDLGLSQLSVTSNSGCMYPKIAETTNNPSGCINYIALDNWFGGVNSFGQVKAGRSLTSILTEPDYKTYHFIAESMLNVPEPSEKFGSQYQIQRKFDGAGPKVFIFKNTACEANTEISVQGRNRSPSIH